MKNIILILALIVTGCFAQTDPEPAPVCGPIKCEALQDKCQASGGVALASAAHCDGASSCWVRTVACCSKSSLKDCIPADCYEEAGYGCER